MAEKRELLVPSSYGVKIAQRFAQQEDLRAWGFAPQSKHVRLIKGGKPDAAYFTAWQHILNNAVHEDVQGRVWYLVQDGDLYKATEVAEAPVVEEPEPLVTGLPDIVPPLDAFSDRRPTARGGHRGEVVDYAYVHLVKNENKFIPRMRIPRVVMEEAFGVDYHQFKYDWRRGAPPNDQWFRLYKTTGAGIKPHPVTGLSMSVGVVFKGESMQREEDYKLEHHVRPEGLFLQLPDKYARFLK